MCSVNVQFYHMIDLVFEKFQKKNQEKQREKDTNIRYPASLSIQSIRNCALKEKKIPQHFFFAKKRSSSDG